MTLRQFVSQRLSPRQKAIVKTFLLILKNQVVDIDLEPRLKLKSELPHKILIGTHHKTGTVWLSSIFRCICHYHSLKFYSQSPNFYSNTLNNIPPKQSDVFLQNHSIFDFNSIKVPFRGMHIIRDPRDVIISGCFYHQKSKEEWLHRPQEKFQGLTYQEKINSYSNVDDQILFEMENTGQNTIHEMLKWDYTNPYFYELKYEELIEDFDLMLFHKIFSFLGFSGSVIPSLLMIAYNNSLFSNQNIKSKHIRSGKKNQWQKHFNPIHKDRFLQLFGDCLIQLGYEDDPNW